MRGCIGKPFALQEAQLILCLLLQNFNFRADDPGYKLTYHQTLTIKPREFFMFAKLRDHIDPIQLERKLYEGSPRDKVTTDNQTKGVPDQAPKKPMRILFGSNTGTCESLAQKLAGVAAVQGFKAKVQTLDSITGYLPKDEPVVIVTASYEGQPTDNAAHFFEWLKEPNGESLKGFKYAVFGCGHRKCSVSPSLQYIV